MVGYLKSLAVNTGEVIKEVTETSGVQKQAAKGDLVYLADFKGGK